MSDVSINASNESPTTTRTPMPLPISPRSAAVALQIDINNPEAITQIAQGLIETLRRRERDHQAERTLTTERLRYLEDQERCYLAALPTLTPPEGFFRNTDQRAPHFVIPIQDGYSQQAYWVRQLSNGSIAAYPKEYKPDEAPYVGELFAQYEPNDDDDDDAFVLPLQPWILDLLKGPSARYAQVCQWIQIHGNWHTVAELMRFRDLEHQRIDTRAHIDHLQSELLGLEQAQDASRGRLELARLPEQVSHLRVLAGAQQRQCSQKRKHWKDL
jgi:hypothetical protein